MSPCASLCASLCALSLLVCAETHYLPHVHTYERVTPHRLHPDRTRRDLHGTQNVYPEHAQYSLSLGGRNYTLRLLKNRGLLSKHYTMTYYLENGTEVTEASDVQDHCFYHGHLEGDSASAASISTCNGISGFLQLHGQMYLIEPLSGSGEEGAHAVYKHEHLRMKRGTCRDSNSSTVYDYGARVSAVLRPQPWRSAPQQKDTRYVELLLVVDKAEYLKYRDLGTLQHRMKEIVNHVDKLYRSLNIRVALIGLDVWTNQDKITVSRNADVTLNNFLTWRKSNLLRQRRHDNAQLITGVDFDGTTVGLATKLAMCTGDSGAVNQDHSANPIGAASTVAHEMGHNLGMSHDENVAGCSCAETQDRGGCVMAERVGMVYPKVFSSCSRRDLQTFLRDASPSCLLNTPDTDQLFGGPVCGNQFVESGEECDCGTLEECANQCCNATSCRLKEGAECAQGDCCQQCKVRPVGEMCRRQKGDCDLPEYCTGSSAACPEDAFQENGAPCGYGSGYCSNGECPSLSQHCKTLWGSDARVAPDTCFQSNMQGSKDLHCRRTAFGYRGCRESDVKCGRLHCVRGNEFPITRKKYVLTLHGGQECKVAALAEEDSGETDDPGMVLSGTKCGMGMVCFEGACRDLSVYGEKNCSAKCNNRGVCNHRRQCHCEPGWAPPYCDRKFTEIATGADRGALIVGVLVALSLSAVLVVGGILYYKRRQKKYPQKRTTTPGSASGLSNPLFQDSSKPVSKKDSQYHLIGRPQLIASTSNLQDCRSAYITITPSQDAEQASPFISNSHQRSPISIPKSPQVTKPKVAPPVPPALNVPSQARSGYPQKPNPPNKPLPALKTKPELKQKPSPAAPSPPVKPSALRATAGPSQKVALRPPVQQRR